MLDYQLVIDAAAVRNVQARIAGLLIPLDVEIVGMQLCPATQPDTKRIQLSVRVPSGSRLETLVKRLNRMIDVIKVVVLDSGECDHHRQSVYVVVRPQLNYVDRVTRILQTYHAEVLEQGGSRLLAHLNAEPEECAALIAALRPHGLLDAVTGAVASYRFGKRSFGPLRSVPVSV